MPPAPGERLAGDTHHHVVEAAVLEVILDPGAAGPGDGAVDHVELAVVVSADVALTPVDALAVGKETAPVGRKEVVDDDLRTGAGQSVYIGRAAPYGREPMPSTITRTSTPSASFRFRSFGHSEADLALAPAEHEDVDASSARSRRLRRSAGRSSIRRRAARSSRPSTTRSGAQRRAVRCRCARRRPPLPRARRRRRRRRSAGASSASRRSSASAGRRKRSLRPEEGGLRADAASPWHVPDPPPVVITRPG